MASVGRGKIGKCREDCETIAYVCESLMRDYEYEIADTFMQRISRKDLDQQICTRECKKEQPITSQTKIKDEKWEEADLQGRATLISLLSQQAKQKYERPYGSPEELHNRVQAQLDNEKMEQEQLKRRARRRAELEAKKSGVPFDAHIWEAIYDKQHQSEKDEL
ncbi:hypothetical protein RFI_04865 [Reticulomyxa filosa]|uniref:Uncharacterized protein n=1 Tax=Reticulomyxa filosa TaxID=46433 RepID=X6P3U7_RETFI|nr:hypothetical protein RFI_04865 [Reticulomyxa filosa]|eukprot:ETO32252.1 hypothetical protein RFI_04865 [Reticulomyxa filosa]